METAINKIRQFAPLLLGLAVSVSASVGLGPRISNALDFSPNRFEANVFTEQVEFQTEAIARFADGDTKSLNAGSREQEFFSDEISEVIFTFERVPELSNDDFLVEGDSLTLRSSERIQRQSRLGGITFDTVLLEFNNDSAIAGLSLDVGLTDSNATYIGYQDNYARFQFDDVVNEYKNLTIRADDSSRPLDEIQSIHLLNSEDPFTLYVRGIHLVRQINRLSDLLIPIIDWDATDIIRWDSAQSLETDFSHHSPGNGSPIYSIASDTPTIELSVPYSKVALPYVVHVLNSIPQPVLYVAVFVVLFGVWILLLYAGFITHAISTLFLVWKGTKTVWICLKQPLGRVALFVRRTLPRLVDAKWITVRRFLRYRITNYMVSQRVMDVTSMNSDWDWAGVRVVNIAGVACLVILALPVYFLSPQSYPGAMWITATIATAIVASTTLLAPKCTSLKPRLCPARFTAIFQQSYIQHIIFGLLAILFVFVYAYRLDAIHMWLDEALSYLPIQGLIETGEQVYPQSGQPYTRAPVYHRLVAYTLQIFDNSVFWARFPNLIFNLGTALVIYLFGRRVAGVVGLASAAVWLSLDVVLEISRWVRMYSLLWFLFALTAYLFYLGLYSGGRFTIRTQLNNVDFRFNPVYVVFGLLLLVVAVDVQRLMIILPFGFVLYFGLQTLLGTKRAVYGFLFLSLTIAIVLFAAYETGTANPYQAFVTGAPVPTDPEWPTDWSLVLRPLSESFPVILLFPLALAACLAGTSKEIRFWTCIAIAGIVFIGLHTTDRFRYVTVILPFLVLAIAGGTWVFLRSTMHRNLKVAFLAFLMLPLLIDTAAVFMDEYARATRERFYYAADQQTELLIDYLSNPGVSEKSTHVITDNHLDFILLSYGIEVDYSFLSFDRIGIGTLVNRDQLEAVLSEPYVMAARTNSSLYKRIQDTDLIADDLQHKTYSHNMFYNPVLLRSQ